MKNCRMNSIRWQLSTLTAAIAFTGVFAETYYLQNSDAKPTALSSNEVWKTSGGIQCDEFRPQDEFVCRNQFIYIRPPTESGSFAGGAVSIGDSTGSGSGSIYLAEGAHVGFPDYGYLEKDGLILRNGVLSIGNTGGKHGIVKGFVTVVSEASNPFRFFSALEGYRLELNSGLRAEEGCAFEYGSYVAKRLNGVYFGYGSIKNTLSLTGDCTDYKGVLTVTNVQPGVTFDADGNLVSYGTRLLLDTDSPFSGKIVINDGCVLECAVTREAYTINSLELHSGSAIILNGSTVRDSDTSLPASSMCPKMLITGNCSVIGDVWVSLPGLSPVPNGCTNRFAVVEVPSGTNLDPSRFRLAGCGTPYVPHRFYAEKEADGRETLYCEFEPYSVLVTSDSDHISNKDFLSSAMTNKLSWSDRGDLRPWVNYVVRKDCCIRTPGGGAKSKYDFTFRGKRLIMCAGSKFMSHCGVFRSSERPLLFLGGSMNFVSQQNTRFIGGIEISGGELSVNAYGGSMFDVDRLLGNGTLKSGTFNQLSSSVSGFYRFRDTAGFSGSINLQQTKDPRAEAGYYRTQNLIIDADSLGSELPEFNSKALQISNESALCLPPEGTDQSLADTFNRGIFIDGIGRVVLTNVSSCLRIDWPITWNGQLWKQGGGTLTLGGRSLFGDSAAEDPVSGGEAELHLHEGRLRIASSAAVDGCRVIVSNGTSIAVSYTADDVAMLRYGFRNAKSSVPFELLEVAGGKLPLIADFSRWEGAFPDVLEFGVLTVSNKPETLESVRAMMPPQVELSGVSHPYKMFITEVEDEDAAIVTFRAKIVRAGFVMVVR